MSKSNKDNEDPRLAATAIISGCTVGALAVCGLFIKEPAAVLVLPLVIIAGAAVGIASAWKYGNRQGIASPNPKELLELEIRVKDLEERIENAETLERFEDRLASKEAALRIEASSSSSSSAPANPASLDNSAAAG